MKKLLLFFTLSSFIIHAQTQIGQDIIGDDSFDFFGGNVSISDNGNTIAVSAVGFSDSYFRVYSNINGTWTQVGQDLIGNGNNLGSAVSVSEDGNIVAVAAPEDDSFANNSGSVLIYEIINDNLELIGSFNGAAGDRLGAGAIGPSAGSGIYLAENGNSIALASAYRNGLRGLMLQFTRNNDEWINEADVIFGDTFYEIGGDGIVLSSNGQFLATHSSAYEADLGLVRVYEKNNNQWQQVGNDLNGLFEFTGFGRSCDLSSDGTFLAIGLPDANYGTPLGSGSVQVYEKVNGSYIQKGQDIVGLRDFERFGFQVSLSSDGSVLAVSAPTYDFADNNVGIVRIYSFINDEWVQVGDDISDNQTFAEFGDAIELSGDGSKIVIGAPDHNSNSEDSNGLVRVYDLSEILSVGEQVVDLDIKLFPNPATNRFKILNQNSLVLKSINIYNSYGQLVSSSKNTSVDASNLAPGVYIVEIESNVGKESTKIIIDR